jgi:hypothetical protein
MLHTNEDFVCAKRFGNSLARLEKRYPDGCPPHVIAGALDIPESQVEPEYEKVVIKLRGLMGVADSL